MQVIVSNLNYSQYLQLPQTTTKPADVCFVGLEDDL